MKTISALTFDTKLDGWEKSRGFVKREIPIPMVDEKKNPRDAVAVLIQVQYAGVCGTDRGIWNRQVFYELIHESLKREKKTRRILGHEFVGKVTAAGSQVENLYGVKVGDDVSGDSHITCGRCFQCRVREDEVCQDQAILGISADGVFAKYIKIPAKNLWQVDFSRIRAEVAAMLDPFGNAVHACSKVDLRGKRVAILGCGPIGMFTILLARAFGAVKVIAVDPNKPNLRMARSLGAHETILLARPPAHAAYADKALEEAIEKFTYKKGVDVTFEMAGPNSSVNNAFAITRGGGHVVLFGLKDGDFVLPHFNRVILKGLTVHGVIGRQIFATWQTSQRMLSDKKNGIQDKIWRIVLKEGKGTILPMNLYNPEKFEEMMKKYPKILIKM
ncbi:MAG: alcohol dehydrogenase catalytic domain-containing protein [Candidatus Spechtbacteria bacterium]|nr:alcohol dehydrogenase catalytic domain-containing protein [Candidatus Spechtbacteria bacterium]